MCPCSLEKANTLPSATTHKFLSPLPPPLSLSLVIDLLCILWRILGFSVSEGVGFQLLYWRLQYSIAAIYLAICGTDAEFLRIRGLLKWVGEGACVCVCVVWKFGVSCGFSRNGKRRCWGGQASGVFIAFFQVAAGVAPAQ